jgi:hypothetical protein
MAKTLTQIETLVKWEARQSDFSCTSVSGLAIFNMIYLRVAAMFPWPELYKADASLVTIADSGEYTWPSSVMFSNVNLIQIQDTEDDLKYKVISPTPTELDFVEAHEEPASFPRYYKRIVNSSNVKKLCFAPHPKYSGALITISGTYEPTEFTQGSDATVFLNKNVDNAIALLIAANIMDKRDYPKRAQRLTAKAAELLSSVAGKEITPIELRDTVENA